MHPLSQHISPAHSAPTAMTRPMRVAVVASSWHSEIVANATTAIHAELRGSQQPGMQVDQFDVPGAFEIPLHAKRLAQSGKYDAIIACGLVVDGGIYRHEFVASAVISGLMSVQLEMDTPIFSAVLTPRDFHAHEEHNRFFREHFIKKGVEVAQACIATLVGLSALPRRDSNTAPIGGTSGSSSIRDGSPARG